MKILALILGIVFVVLAVVAIAGVATFLPALGFDGRHHVKHAILYTVLAVLCFIWMRFSANAAVTR